MQELNVQHFYYIFSIVGSIGAVGIAIINLIAILRQNLILATMKKELAELELRIITKLNGTYVRTELCHAFHDNTDKRLDKMEDKINDIFTMLDRRISPRPPKDPQVEFEA